MPVRNLAEFLQDPPVPEDEARLIAEYPENPEPQPREELPREFEEKVRIALEYAMAHQHLDEHECCRRRHRTDEWLDTLRRPGAYREWVDGANRRHAAWTKKSKKDREDADARAEALLRSVLSERQLRELDGRGYFHVHVGERRFRLTRGRSGNIKEVDARSRILRTFCVHPIEDVPVADVLVAQKLYLEANPEALFKLANVRRHRYVRQPTQGEIERDHRRAREQIARFVQRGVLERAEQEALDASALRQDEPPAIPLDPRDLRPIRAIKAALANGDAHGNDHAGHPQEEPARGEVPGPHGDARQDRVGGPPLRASA